MKLSKLFSAQRFIKQIADWLETALSTAIKERIQDVYDDGIAEGEFNNMAIVGKDVNALLTDFFHVQVRTGVGYKTGERILIDVETITYDATNISDTTNDGLGNFVSTPHSTGSFNIPLTAGSINYLYIAHLDAIDEIQFTAHKLTGAKQFYKQVDGYNIQVNLTGINPDPTQFVFLGQVDLTGVNQAITSNISIVNRDKFRTQLKRVKVETNNVGLTDRPAVYAVGQQELYVEEHIKAVGTGTVSPTNAHGLTLTDLGVSAGQTVEIHRQLEHSNGIIAGSPGTPDPIASAMSTLRTQVSPGDDFIIVKALAAGEFAIVNGVAFSSTDFPSDVTVTFTGDLAGTYNIYFDSVTETIGKTTSSIASDITKLWLGTTTWDTSIVGDGNLSVPLDRRQFGTLNKISRWVTSARPPLPMPSNFGYNMDVNKLEYYNGTTWIQL